MVTGSWSEEMIVCELLYARSNITLAVISARARVAMRNDGVEAEGAAVGSKVWL